MLTRLEADGFKNLLDFSLEFGPFTCLAGANAVGKSNVFDAIRFLSLLADHSLMEAALAVRDSNPETSDIRDLFWRDKEHAVDKMRLAAEMIVEPRVADDFGRPAEATSTFLRYEVEIGYQQPRSEGGLGALTLLSETLDYITEKSARRRLRFPHSAGEFRKGVVSNERRTRAGYISTICAKDGQTEILVHQDGGSRGNPQRAPASSAPNTIVGTTNTSATPTILAAKREMQKWRILALEPSAMRRSDRFLSDQHITSSGGHMPASLNRLTRREGDGRNTLARVANRLAHLVPVDAVSIDRDQARQLLTLEILEPSGVKLPARALSDGTLRFLVLSILAEDDEAKGLICMEEPENGIHPAKVSEVVELLYDLAVDPGEKSGPENPLRQVIVASHSPVLVQLIRRDDLVLALEAKIRSPEGRVVTTLRCKPMIGTWRTSDEDRGVGLSTLISYLTYPSDAQLALLEPEDSGDHLA